MQDCKLNADVYRPERGGQNPAILWLHGGGLIFGNRSMLPADQIQLYIEAGYTVISMDYRLAPETKLNEILKDVRDGYNWIVKEGPDLFSIDPDRIAIIGHSSGGYLAMMIGASLLQKPSAIISLYGYGDITGKWCSCPCQHYIKEPDVSPEIAYKGVGETAIAGSEFTGLEDKRWLFYLYCRQKGLWPNEVTGHDFLTSPERFQPYCLIHQNFQSCPPTLLLHGDQDTDVPFEQSKQVATLLEQNQVHHQLIQLKGLGHMFDLARDDSTGLNHPKVAKAFNVVIAFLDEHLS